MAGAFLHAFASPSRERFISIARGDGARLWDAEGNEYLDAMASLWYCAVGHGRREIADAVHAQMVDIEAYSCFEPFTNAPADALCDAIAERSPITDARIFLCGSGSEAIDTAIKLTRLSHRLAGQPERTLVISREGGYHGTNLGGTSAQGIPANREGFGPLVPEVVNVPGHDIEALSVLMAAHADRVAAVIAEPVQGAGGVLPPPEGYLAGLRRLCDQHGALLVFDEVITGFGRLGTWFGAGHYQVVPDVITFAKAVTSGYQPLGGVILGPSVMGPLEADPEFVLRHGYTYSGHPSACAAALANLEILEREELLTAAARIGDRLRDGLEALVADGVIAGARGVGAVWAAVLHPDHQPAAVRDAMLGDGVITRAIGADACTFCPPLVTTDAQVDRMVDSLATAVTGLMSIPDREVSS